MSHSWGHSFKIHITLGTITAKLKIQLSGMKNSVLFWHITASNLHKANLRKCSLQNR